ncbi:uncharacterized protein PRCAT00002308001 [Priceomyces carsonii]|uniref:uncharacterized protein n=1 Tax=Priceomyces carsonii TaxID=28549 RepID=UPI002ED7B07C|nr:unnamed protein product [Priceomyces carsonii]
MTKENIWWKDATVYQVWPASYKDSNSDGIGDIPGIISKLDHIQGLGVDVIWLSPMYDSPQDDMGYDISDYQKVYPKYGTLEDLETLIKETHSRGMKLILDLVINHTSNEHQWFKESRSSKTNPKRDWYIWKPPRYDENGNRHPPNNWMSCFCGSAWEYDEKTEEYYLHVFAKSQPDLNWENEETRQAIYDNALLFWFEKGIDGFRIDAAGVYSKDRSFPDAPIVIPNSEWQPCTQLYQDGPRIHEFHKEMFSKVTSKFDAMTVGEVGASDREEFLKYVSAKENEMNMMFLFNVVDIGSKNGDKFDFKGFNLVDLKKAIKKQYSMTDGSDAWPTFFMENHDQARSISRFGNPSTKYWEKSGKLLALLQIGMSGTLFIYQGQEIGMTNFPRSWPIEDYLDINSINYFKNYSEKHSNDAKAMDKLMDNLALLARDHGRTPVQWDDSPNAGFSDGVPWTKVNDNYHQINVQKQVNDPSSLLSFWKRCLKLRKKFKNLLVHGSLDILDLENENLFTFSKRNNGELLYGILNFSSNVQKFELTIPGTLELLLSNSEIANDDIMGPYEGRLYLVK